MLIINLPRKDYLVRKCTKCKKIKQNNAFGTYAYDNAPNKNILMMSREDDLHPRCIECQEKINERIKIKNNLLKNENKA